MRSMNTGRHLQAGMSLVEIMIAVTIGVFIIGAIGSVYIGNKNIYRTSEAASRLQDEARVAVALIRHSLQHAGYFGRLDNAITINGRRNSGSDLSLPFTDCAPGWSIDLDIAVDSPDTTGGNPFAATCLYGSRQRNHQAGTDILVVRRVDTATSDPGDADHLGKIFLRADLKRGELFIADGGTAPTGYSPPPLGEDRQLVTEMYYVTPDSYSDGDGIPMLRRLFSSRQGSTPDLRSEQVAENVEQFQVQFGEDVDGDGQADLFVNPANVVPGRAVSVRFWLLIRSGIREADFVDENIYEFANVVYMPPPELRAYRRILVSQTVDLRNL